MVRSLHPPLDSTRTFIRADCNLLPGLADIRRMILQAGEKPVASEQIPWATGPGAFQHLIGALQLTNYSVAGQPLSGNLYLTDRRIVFEGMTREVGIGYMPKTMLDLSLAQITNVIATLGPNRQPLLRVEAGPGFAYTFATPNAQNWVAAILGWRSSLLSAGTSSQPTTTPVVVQVQQPQPTVYLHCKQCGTLSPAGSSRCSSCGAAL